MLVIEELPNILEENDKFNKSFVNFMKLFLTNVIVWEKLKWNTFVSKKKVKKFFTEIQSFQIFQTFCKEEKNLPCQ